MRKLIHPLVQPALYRGWIHACLGAVASLPPLLVAVLSAPQGRPATLRIFGFVLGFAVLVAVMAAPRTTRRVSVAQAEGLLGVSLPAPLDRPPSRRSVWSRTWAWLVVHMVIGGAVAASTGLLVFSAVLFPAVWLGGTHDLTFLGLVLAVPDGWQGSWSIAMTAGSLLTAGYLMVLATIVLRHLASALLGLSPAERLVAAEAHINVAAHRNRLAQELHDSIGHTLTASTIQAAVALELMDQDPEAVRRALGTIEHTSRTAMDDLDHVLSLLRRERPSERPQPTLADLHRLDESLRLTGAELTVEIDGDLHRVPQTASREAYRIIQESLTNALRHGEKDGILLRVAVHSRWLDVHLANRVDTDVSARDTTPRGRGLAGITERVRLLHGSMSAGFTDDGTQWQVNVRIPLHSMLALARSMRRDR